MPNERDYALVVGIEYYPFLQANLIGTHTDATAVRDWLIGPGGLPNDKDHIKLILSEVRNNDPAPVKKQIDDAFDDIFEHAKAQRGGRRLYVYFAGHGGAREQRHLAVLLGDAKLQRLNSGLNTSLYHEGLGTSALFPQQILFYDCCRNFDQRFVGQPPDWTDFGEDDASAGAADLPSVQQWVVYAAGFTQFANGRETEPSMERGLFTKALLEGLHGEAADLNGTITMLSLMDYVKERLDKLTEPRNLRQSLSWNPVGEYGDLVVAEGIAAPSIAVEVLAPAPIERVIVRSRNFQVIDSKDVHAGVAAFQIPKGIYIFCVEPVPPGGTGMQATYIPIPPHNDHVVRF